MSKINHESKILISDDCNIPMPAWVRNVAYSGNWDIFYTDRAGYRDQECLSLGVDNVPGKKHQFFIYSTS